jgi:hypothetical protein
MLQKTSLIAILLIAALTSCKPTKDDYRKDFVKGCVNRYAKDSTVANIEGRKYVEEFCSCMGDQLNAKMDADQWRTFNKEGDTTLAAFKPVIEPCANEFRKKVSAIKH